ncbi:MAG: NUDIX domain-containing protein [Bacteroidetes bacterium]|nr:NUDIX domain-containing protein [Bacteroidota bacterium]
MSKQNYTIFTNQNSISLVSVAQKFNPEISLSFLKKYAKQCLNKDENIVEHFVVKTHSPAHLIRLLKNEFKFIQAAGGIVEENGKFLYIKRFDHWDLPKGKLEKNESEKEGALREVREECGIQNLKIISELPKSYHLYLFNGKPALKETFWFLMRSTEKITNLKPQTEEGITEVRFENQNFLLQPNTKTYPSLVDLIKKTESYLTSIKK